MTEVGKFAINVASNEISLSAPITPMHRALLASYQMNAHRGRKAARDLILSDVKGFLDLGAVERATDLLIVLALFLKEGKLHDRRSGITATRRQREPISLQRWRGSQPRFPYFVNRGREKCVGGLRNLRLVMPPRDPSENDDGDARR
ncbi:MAG: hypothetical protein CTY15_02275 [Methylocystis sp.]|nr:MAG: hypothetical protein CTY15_02275 [Methylocystis sp.]